MKLYTDVIHCLQMCMKEYGSATGSLPVNNLEGDVSVTIPE
jgi:hypothetical protein